EIFHRQTAFGVKLNLRLLSISAVSLVCVVANLKVEPFAELILETEGLKKGKRQMYADEEKKAVVQAAMTTDYNYKQATAALKKRKGLHDVSTTKVQRWMTPMVAKRMGRPKNELFQHALVDELVYYSIEKVNDAARMVQSRMPFCDDPLTKELKLSKPWVKEKVLPPAEVVDTRLKEIQSAIVENGFAAKQILNADETGNILRRQGTVHGDASLFNTINTTLDTAHFKDSMAKCFIEACQASNPDGTFKAYTDHFRGNVAKKTSDCAKPVLAEVGEIRNETLAASPAITRTRAEALESVAEDTMFAAPSSPRAAAIATATATATATAEDKTAAGIGGRTAPSAPATTGLQQPFTSSGRGKGDMHILSHEKAYTTSPEVVCKDCNKVFSGGVTRIKVHIVKQCTCSTERLSRLRQNLVHHAVEEEKQRGLKREREEADAGAESVRRRRGARRPGLCQS
ncbi:MAG: hypothetical protein SGPRY_011767, partial [Prymnesium sp.]